jgi:hypothetical protein
MVLGIAGVAAATITSGLVLATAEPALALGWQRGWRYCGKCNGLFYGGFGTFGLCAAGGQHTGSPDNGTSLDYMMIYGFPAGTNRQTGWSFCIKCRNIAYSNGGPGICAHSGRHDHSSTLAYGIEHD